MKDPDQWFKILLEHVLLNRAFVSIEDGKIAGLAIYGLVHTAESAFESGYNPVGDAGRVIWCPYLAATGIRHILGMIRAAARRHPHAETLAYRRRRVHLVKISLRRTSHGWKSSIGRNGSRQVPLGAGAGG